MYIRLISVRSRGFAFFNFTVTLISVGKSSIPNGPVCSMVESSNIRLPIAAIGFLGLPIVKCHRPTLSPLNNEFIAYRAGRPNAAFSCPFKACDAPNFLSIFPRPLKIDCTIFTLPDAILDAPFVIASTALPAPETIAELIDAKTLPKSSVPLPNAAAKPPNLSKLLSIKAFTFLYTAIF